ncbi:MAG: chemotaxis protein CheA [Deltaproteobacteria bacterium]|nr:chemotaxis protein CheA [Deltaproteobacteria bacterium]
MIQKAAASKKSNESKEPKKDSKSGSGDNMRKMMRVDESTVDGFMKYVGELIIASEVFNYIQKKLENETIDPQLSKEFKNANLSFNELSNDLQRSLMDIRRVPVKNLLSKAPRLVRDLSLSLSKEAKLETDGEEVKIDKSLVETLEDPLIHILRNSIDHGLETPEERTANGKDPCGTIRVEGFCDKKYFNLLIKDDGRGIDPEKIKKVAVKKGVISELEAAELSDQEAVNLIFAPGFSSAEEITQVSGRGVGMDVVLTNIKRSNGSVEVTSEIGKGTEILIRLPLTVTLIVINGLVVKTGDEFFIIPIESVKEVTQPTHEMLSTISGNNEVVRFREEVYPLIRVGELMKSRGFKANQELSEQTLVLIEKEDRKASLIVDELVGLQQVVLKNIGDEFKRVRFIQGGAILGDGRIGLVLDAKHLIDKFVQDLKKRAGEKKTSGCIEQSAAIH